jgi:plastocyanin
MRVLHVSLALLLALVLAACSADAEPGWTYAPAASTTPAPSASGSAQPSASVPAAPSGTPAGSTGPSGEPSATVVAVAAPVGSSLTGFDPTAVTAPANTPFNLVFDNQDTGVLHNVVLNDPSGSPVNIGDTAFFAGPEERTYEVPSLAAGAYPFLCQVHPTTMTGTLTVE